MSHNYKIQKLADFLADIGLEKEASELLFLIRKANRNFSVDDWYEVIREVDADYVDPLYNEVSKYLSSAAHHLQKAAPELQDITKEEVDEIMTAIPVDELIKGAMSQKNLLKYAAHSDADALVKAAELCHNLGFIEKPDYKKAGWWQWTKTLTGKTIGKVIPFASFILAIINMYYCVLSLWKLMSELPSAGLAWYDFMRPQELAAAAHRNKEDPELLKNIAKATKTAKVFIKEYISLVANYIDGLKDLIFMFVDIASGGWGIALDVGISFLIMAIEFGIQSYTSAPYDLVIVTIRQNAVEHVLAAEFQPREKKEEVKFPEFDQGSFPSLDESEFPKI